jgi:hypothetical protein
VSTAVAERLDSLVTKDPPPCEVMIRGKHCGQPSQYKLHRECECGAKTARHMCEECYFHVMMGDTHCHFCLKPIINWTIA